MHELSIVMGIVDVVNDHFDPLKWKKVDRIELDIGTLSGIEMSALNFVWDSAVRDTLLEGAEKQVNWIKAAGKCLDCENVFELDSFAEACPACGNYFHKILRGKELQVKAIEVS
jgi:hydrogenase nickel incorporation protein HypA/HybF